MIDAVVGLVRDALRARRGPRGRFGRSHPVAPVNLRRTPHRLDTANSVTICAVFLLRPRYRTFRHQAS